MRVNSVLQRFLLFVELSASVSFNKNISESVMSMVTHHSENALRLFLSGSHSENKG